MYICVVYVCVHICVSLNLLSILVIQQFMYLFIVSSHLTVYSTCWAGIRDKINFLSFVLLGKCSLLFLLYLQYVFMWFCFIKKSMAWWITVMLIYRGKSNSLTTIYLTKNPEVTLSFLLKGLLRLLVLVINPWKNYGIFMVQNYSCAPLSIIG